MPGMWDAVALTVLWPPPPISQAATGSKLVDFKNALGTDAEVAALRGEVQAFARTFPMPGWDVSTMRFT
jgi:hypothetical protein